MWQKLLMFTALGKAAVVGASLGLALLGALGFAEAVMARDWLNEMQRAYAFDIAAAAGAGVGIVGQLAKLYLRA